MRDIDQAWLQYGLDAYVPPPFHYWVVTLFCALPFMLVISLLCCISDDEVLSPEEMKKPQHTAEGAKNVKVSQKPEKLE